MNRIIPLTLAILTMAHPAKCQVAKWLIPPQYDDIRLANNGKLIATDSIGKTILWSLSGKRLASTKYHLAPFKEELSVATKKGTSEIAGFFNANGEYTTIANCQVAHSSPYFSGGYLLVQQDNLYKFVDTEGTVINGRYARALPFINGYASCTTFENMQKMKDPYNLMLTKDNERVLFTYQGKQFDGDDIEFISSVNDENVAIVVAKHKLYYFNGKNKSLSPIYAKRGETNKKNQARLEDHIDLCLTRENRSTTVLKAKCGKNNTIRIKFDNLLIPLSITLEEGVHEFKKREPTQYSTHTPLRTTQSNDKYGISWDTEEILPPQLDELIKCFNDKALVRLSGKCGMLQIIKDQAFKITLNKGNPIDFRHQKYETTIRLDLPKDISAFSTRIHVKPETGCLVDMTSGEKKDTEFGNFIQYNCVLNIPESLPDEMYGDSRNEITYPTQIIYHGLTSPTIPFKVKAWHYKYFNVDINDAETSINQGTLSFTFNINAERTPGDAVYPTTVNIQTDSLQCELEKISETRYKCKVIRLNEGNNNIIVQILEQGCPPATFPFEVTYTKPSERTRNKPAVKEDVVIKKKTKKTHTVPHLDI